MPMVGLLSVQPDGSVMVTDVPNTEVAVPVLGLHDEKPDSEKSMDEGDAKTNPVGNVVVIVSPAASAVVGVKLTCQSDIWLAYAG